ncbi:hypothetical protein [Pseudonocardia sp. ICBG601]|nr:hypothetical protein [Pseudonocardia sp. ICBG601]
MLACDMVVASTTARFGLPEVARGLARTAVRCSARRGRCRSTSPSSCW